MQRRKFSREFKVEAVKLVRERGVSVAQAGRDLARLSRTPSTMRPRLARESFVFIALRQPSKEP